jgi:hypothetical protein
MKICEQFINGKMCIICITRDYTTLAELKTLDCSECTEIKFIPKELVNLVELICDRCPALTTIPKELIHLKKLICWGCRCIKEIPREFTSLEILECDGCPISNIPKELLYLRILDCSYCPIKEIPKELVKLTVLKCNERYDCPLLTHIPKELINLTVLWIGSLLITHIPKEFVNLKELYCANCTEIKEIPKEFVNLKILNCSGCINLVEIPNLINLTELCCLNCPSLIEIHDLRKNSKFWSFIHKYIITIYKVRFDCNCTRLTFIPTHFIDSDHLYNNNDKSFMIKFIEDNCQTHRQQCCKRLLDTIFEELIARTWHPSRVIDWCWDEDEKKFMNTYVR